MSSTSLDARTVSVVTFVAAGHSHAVATESVQEVLRMVAMRPVSGAPSWVAGVVNLRGTPMIVVDLSERLTGESTQHHLSTPIIVTRIGSGAPVGLIVDSVDGLRDVAGDVQTAAWGATLLRLDDTLVDLVDIQKITDEVAGLVAA